MDISLLKTFLELSQTRHFGKAASGLFLTQSAVSARVRLLEEELGVKLFARDRNNIHLTPAGIRFQRYAESIIETWNRARQDTALEDESKVLLSVGGTHSLWDIGLQHWLFDIQDYKELAFKIEALTPENIFRGLNNGSIDLGFMFESPQTKNIEVQEIGKTELVLVSTHKKFNTVAAVSQSDYIMIDWGTDFLTAHARHFSEIPPPNIRIGLGHLGLNFLLAKGGSAYLARNMIQDLLKDGRLVVIEEAPIIVRKIYAGYSDNCTRLDVVNRVIEAFSKQKYF